MSLLGVDGGLKSARTFHSASPGAPQTFRSKNPGGRPAESESKCVRIFSARAEATRRSAPSAKAADLRGDIETGKAAGAR
jgi:hypothetical protein